MTEFIISWIMWALVATTNPNVNIIAVLDEFPRQDTCTGIAKQVAIAAAADIEVKQIQGIESVTVVCIPFLTRDSEDADKSLFQRLPGKGHERTTIG